MGNVKTTASRDKVLQSGNWVFGSPVAGDDALPVWTLRTPEGLEDEAHDVIEEIIPEDGGPGCYNVPGFIKPGELWVDAGSHLGVFSIAVLQRGATPVTMIDCSESLLRRAVWSVRGFVRLVEAMQSLPSGSIMRPYPVQTMIHEAQDITRVLGAKVSGYTYGLKLDIQGHESGVLTPAGAAALGRIFGKLIVEWHDPDMLTQVLRVLEGAGWYISTMHRHEDVLLETETYILFATRG
jgi:hypothetical protein